MNEENAKHNKILLHACCGPCSLEPIRLYREAGVEPTVFFSNSNIAPAEEYELRRDTIKQYCKSINVDFIEDEYDNEMWKRAVREHIECKPDRCRECYKMRFQRCCKYACDNGFDTVSTTLTISPYQYIDIIYDELQSACQSYGLKCGFKDFSEHFYDAQARARELGLYRQHYCGCIPSKLEAEQGIALLKQAKHDKAEIREAELNKKRAERSAYSAKRAKQKEILKSLRQKEHRC